MKKRKVLEINSCGVNLKGYYEEGKVNPWRLYRVWWDRGEHRKMLCKHANFISVAMHIKDTFWNIEKAWKD